MQAIEAAAIHGGHLTSNLLAPTDSPPPARRLDLNRQIKALKPLISALTKSVRYDLCENSLSVNVEPDAIDAVIVELVANARAAGATNVVIRTRLAGARVWLTIADNGCGMLPSKLTKVRQCMDQRDVNGTGLSRIQRFALSAHARLHFRSRVGDGTVISLTFPPVLRLASGEPDAAARMP
jgi:signal transduction histidine kinase